MIPQYCCKECGAVFYGWGTKKICPPDVGGEKGEVNIKNRKI